MKLEFEAGFNADRMYRRPNASRHEFIYSDGTTDTTYWASLFGFYIQLTIQRGKA